MQGDKIVKLYFDDCVRLTQSWIGNFDKAQCKYREECIRKKERRYKMIV